MKYRYAVLGTGRQGVAAAYDMAKFGNAERIVLADSDLNIAKTGAERVNKLLNQKIATAVQVDVRDSEKLASILNGITSFVSAVPYQFNLKITEIAIDVKANMCDLGGNTDIVRRQLKYDTKAKAADVTIVPDCGMGPGMNISLALEAMILLDEPQEVYIWDGGLPQDPKPPWNYLLTFNIGGLTNEYYGYAYFLRDYRITKVPCLTETEEVDFPPLGRLEAFVTSGGLSTMPWTFEGKLKRLENKTLRYPGHCAQFKAFSQLGLLELKPMTVGNLDVVPRDVLHTLLEPKITQPKIYDICVIRVKCIGKKDGRHAEAAVELIDYYNEKTGFTAMERLTGWHASIVAILAAQGRLPRGVIPIELAVPGPMFMKEAKRRRLAIKECINITE